MPDPVQQNPTSRRENDVSRRQVMSGAATSLAGAALLVVTGVHAEAQTAKMTQQAAKYQSTPKGSQKCATCTNFQPPDSCKVVQGKVSPNGWCQMYAKKS